MCGPQPVPTAQLPSLGQMEPQDLFPFVCPDQRKFRGPKGGTLTSVLDTVTLVRSKTKTWFALVTTTITISETILMNQTPQRVAFQCAIRLQDTIELHAEFSTTQSQEM